MRNLDHPPKRDLDHPPIRDSGQPSRRVHLILSPAALSAMMKVDDNFGIEWISEDEFPHRFSGHEGQAPVTDKNGPVLSMNKDGYVLKDKNGHKYPREDERKEEKIKDGVKEDERARKSKKKREKPRKRNVKVDEEEEDEECLDELTLRQRRSNVQKSKPCSWRSFEASQDSNPSSPPSPSNGKWSSSTSKPPSSQMPSQLPLSPSTPSPSPPPLPSVPPPTLKETSVQKIGAKDQSKLDPVGQAQKCEEKGNCLSTTSFTVYEFKP